MLKTQVEEISTNKVALTVEVETDRVRKAFESFYVRAAKSVSIPGFRKGKIPRPVLMKHLGKEAIQEQVEEELIREVYPAAIKEANLHPISSFQLKESKLEEGLPFTFKGEFEVRPKIGEFSYTGFDSAVPCAIVDDENVARVLEQLRERYSKTTPIENGTLEIGDYFLGNIQVTVDGQVDKELSEERGYHKFSEHNLMLLPMKGMTPKETKSFSYEVKGDSEKDSKYFGKTLQIEAQLEGISRAVLPQLSDDFAKEVGDYKSLDELKAKIREDLERHSREQAEERAYDSILKKISDNLKTLEVPEAMIQSTIDFFLTNLDQRWRQFGTSIQEYLKKSNKDYKEFRETFREKAVFQTRVMLIVDGIADKEKLEVSDGEFRDEIEKRAGEAHMAVDKLMEALAKDDGEENLKFALRSRKIREFLLKNNNIRYDMVKEADLNKGETQGDAGTDSN